MKLKLGICCLILNIIGLNAFIIPDELPSILSVIYSNIPTLKKGTDSRIGWGFRLGDRADFQVLVELGPQTNTQPLANQGEGGANKRNTLNNLANTLYAQRQEEKKQKLIKKEKDTLKSEGGQGGEWLQNWSNTISKSEDEDIQPVSLSPKPGIAIGEIDAKSVIPDDAALEEMEKENLKTLNKQLKTAEKASSKKPAINRSLISILTEGKESRPDSAIEEKDKLSLDNVSLE